jgi:hypothetical protein
MSSDRSSSGRSCSSSGSQESCADRRVRWRPVCTVCQDGSTHYFSECHHEREALLQRCLGCDECQAGECEEHAVCIPCMLFGRAHSTIAECEHDFEGCPIRALDRRFAKRPDWVLDVDGPHTHALKQAADCPVCAFAGDCWLHGCVICRTHGVSSSKCREHRVSTCPRALRCGLMGDAEPRPTAGALAFAGGVAASPPPEGSTADLEAQHRASWAKEIQKVLRSRPDLQGANITNGLLTMVKFNLDAD